MSNIPELFANSMNQSRAAAIERYQFDERMRMEEEKALNDENFRRFQMEKMSEELRLQERSMTQNKAYQDQSLAQSRLSSARSAWTMVSDDDPVVSAYKLATIGYDQYKNEAGPLAQGGPNARFVDKEAYARAYHAYEKNQARADEFAPITVFNDFLKENIQPTFPYRGKKNVVIPGTEGGMNMSNMFFNLLPRSLRGGEVREPYESPRAASLGQVEADMEYINPEYLNALGEAWAKIRMSPSRFAPGQMQLVASIAGGQLDRLGGERGVEKFAENADAWGYDLNPSALTMIQQLIYDRELLRAAAQKRDNESKMFGLNYDLKNAQLQKLEKELQ